MALEGLGIVVALWGRCLDWLQKQPDIEIAGVFLDEPSEGDRNLTVAVVNNGSREVYMTVAVEGPGRQQQEHAPMKLDADGEKGATPGKKAFDRPLEPHGKRRFYRRTIGMLTQFARHEAQVVVRSLGRKRGVLARSDIPPHLWP